jgi:AraC-like DNA-binding protein
MSATVPLPGPNPSTGRYQTHDFWEMGVVLHGTYRHETISEKTVLSPGGCWWVGPWEPHSYTIFEGGTRILIIGFIPAALSALTLNDPHPPPYAMPFLRPGSRSKLRRQPPESRKRILGLAEDWALLLKNRPAGWQTIERFYFGLILAENLLSGNTSPDITAGKGQKAEQILHAVDFINRNLHRKLHLDEASRSACLGRTQFIRHFKVVMGTPFAKYIIQRRLERVRSDLLNGGYKLETMARRWGFCDASHLIRQYKKFYGTTPKL